MENWGLNLYREELLTYNPYYVNARQLSVMVTVIHHEMAHQVRTQLLAVSVIVKAINKEILTLPIIDR